MPKKRTETKPGHKDMLDHLCDFIDDLLIDEYAPHENFTKPKVVWEASYRYDRIYTDGGNFKDIYCFICRGSGDILKPATYKRPAKRARGNLFDRESWPKWLGPFGPHYLIR